MFHLLSSLYTDLTQRPRFNVLFLGPSQSGKTALLQTIKTRYLDNKGVPPSAFIALDPNTPPALPKTRPTVGQNVIDVPAPLPSQRPLVQPIYPLPSIEPPLSPSGSSSSISSWFSSGPPTPVSSSKRPPSKAVLHIWDLGGEEALQKIWKKYYAETDCVVYFWDCKEGGQGEARQQQWEKFAQLASEPELCTLPFLILLSRCDLIQPPASRQIKAQTSAPSTPAAPPGASESDASRGQTVKGPSMDLEEEAGDLSLSIERSPSQRDLSEVAKTDPDAGSNAASDGAASRAHPSDLASPSSAMTEKIPSQQFQTHDADGTSRVHAAESFDSGTDLIESLRVFIQSHIEAEASRRLRVNAAAAAAARGSRDQSANNSEDPAASPGAGADDVKDEQAGAATSAAGPSRPSSERAAALPPFPETTIIPLSLSLTSSSLGQAPSIPPTPASPSPPSAGPLPTSPLAKSPLSPNTPQHGQLAQRRRGVRTEVGIEECVDWLVHKSVDALADTGSKERLGTMGGAAGQGR